MTKRTADRIQRFLTVVSPAVLGLGVMFLNDLSAVLYVFIPFGVAACVWALYYRSANVTDQRSRPWQGSEVGRG